MCRGHAGCPELTMGVCPPQDPRGSRMTEWRHLEPFCCGEPLPLPFPFSFYSFGGCTFGWQMQ